MFTFYCFNLNLYIIFILFYYFYLFIYAKCIQRISFFCFIKLLLFYMLYVYTWCENDSAIENSRKINYVTKFK